MQGASRSLRKSSSGEMKNSVDHMQAQVNNLLIMLQQQQQQQQSLIQQLTAAPNPNPPPAVPAPAPVVAAPAPTPAVDRQPRRSRRQRDAAMEREAAELAPPHAIQRTDDDAVVLHQIAEE